MIPRAVRWAAGLAAMAVAAPLPGVAQEVLGDFYFFDRSAPDTGEDRSSLTTLADESHVSGAGGLTFRCAERGLEVVLTATYLGRRMSAPVRYSFAGHEPRADEWSVRSSGMAAVAPPDVAVEFVLRATAEDTVVVHATDFQMRVHTYTFHLEGLREGLARLECAAGTV